VAPQRASTRRVFARYLAFEAPSWVLLAVALAVLARVWDLSISVAAFVLALWVVKDLALFPILRIAYEPGGGSGGAENLIGSQGIVSADLDPEGWVRIGAERWRARVSRGHGPVPAGAAVRVTSIEGLLLRVEPASRVTAGEGPDPSRADA
jgi:membrane-bound ClpP family serine protease